LRLHRSTNAFGFVGMNSAWWKIKNAKDSGKEDSLNRKLLFLGDPESGAEIMSNKQVCVLLGCMSWLFLGWQVRVSGQVDDPSSTRLTNSIGMKLVRIPAGRFSMGSPASEPGSEEHEVLHKVELTQDYFMGVTEVTEQQWATVMLPAFTTQTVERRDPETNRLIKREEVQVREPKLGSQLPMTGISWQEAMDFCRRLGDLPEEKKEGRRYRLPTEAEWERACRAETSSAYSFGDDRSKLKDYAWHGSKEAKPVGQLKPNPWGLYDMHGNAAEWCYDYYGAYPEGLVNDPSSPEKLMSLERVVRGGWFESKESWCRSGWRRRSDPGAQSKSVGFRVVLGPEIPSRDLPSEMNSIGQRLVTIPAGEFLMGRSERGGDEERPVREVTISRPFQFSATEVMQGQWQAVMGTTPWKGKDSVIEGDDYPATYVSWDDAMEFCRRLSSRPDEKKSGRVYRLPTEAEWEYACRGGIAAEYGFGDDERMLGSFGWFDRNSEGHPQPVGKKLPNAFGLLDMHGNVWEWCSDVYAKDYYRNAPGVDPHSAKGSYLHVIRGGSWYDVAASSRSASRFYAHRTDSDNSNYGFRVAASFSEVTQSVDVGKEK
jgi:formylglycine-generating enzyme required for sulfatase activity